MSIDRLTPGEYMDRSDYGTCCPCCGGKDPAGGKPRYDDDAETVRVDYYCRECAAEWSEYFKLEGVELESPDDDVDEEY